MHADCSHLQQLPVLEGVAQLLLQVVEALVEAQVRYEHRQHQSMLLQTTNNHTNITMTSGDSHPRACA